MDAPAWVVRMTGPAAEGGPIQPSPWPAAGWEVDEVLLNLAPWCSVAIVYTLLCYTLLPRHDFHGSPLYSWLSCLPVQFIGFPYVTFTALSSFPHGDRDAPFESVLNYMLAPWTMLDQTAERNFLLLMFSFMFKDMGLYLVGGKMDASYWAHHIICWFIQLHLFFTDGVGPFVTAGMAMELGSGTQTLHNLFPNSRLLDLAHVAVMTMSHVVAIFAAVIYVQLYVSFPTTPLWIRASTAVLICILCWARQQNAMLLHSLFNKRMAEQKSK